MTGAVPQHHHGAGKVGVGVDLGHQYVSSGEAGLLAEALAVDDLDDLELHAVPLAPEGSLDLSDPGRGRKAQSGEARG